MLGVYINSAADMKMLSSVILPEAYSLSGGSSSGKRGQKREGGS